MPHLGILRHMSYQFHLCYLLLLLKHYHMFILIRNPLFMLKLQVTFLLFHIMLAYHNAHSMLFPVNFVNIRSLLTVTIQQTIIILSTNVLIFGLRIHHISMKSIPSIAVSSTMMRMLVQAVHRTIYFFALKIFN